MRKQIVLVLILLLAAFLPADFALADNAPGSASPPAAAAPTAAAGVGPQGTLYRVRSQGHTAYLFGTIHVGKPDFYPLEPQVTQAFKKADVLAVEFDISDSSTTQQAMFKYALYPNFGTVDTHISPKTLERLKKSLATLNLPYEGMSHMKPWMSANMLLISSLEKQGYQSSLATDTYFINAAKEQNKPIVGLESADYQLGLFDKLPAKEQEAYLNDSMDDIESGTEAKKNQELLAAWEHADEKAFDGLLDDAKNDKTVSGRFFYRDLLQKRNPPMADKVAAMIKAHDNSFVAVGLLHLVGKDGVPELLKKKGFTVEQVY